MNKEETRSNPLDPDFAMKVSEALAAVMADEKTPCRLRNLRLDAIVQLSHIIEGYKKKLYLPVLVEAIWQKKLDFIMGATSNMQMEEILNPKPPHYNGAAFIPSRYLCPEEELLLWTETSLWRMPDEAAIKRHMDLFEQVFGKRAENLQA